MGHFLLAHQKSKLELRRLPKIEVSMYKWSALLFDPPIQLKKGEPWAKYMG